MFYRFSKTSSKESNLVLVRNCCFARLIDCINSLLDIILRVSFILCQSSILITTDFGLPSGVVINSTLGISTVFNTVKSPCRLIMDSLLKENGISQQWEGSKKKDSGSFFQPFKYNIQDFEEQGDFLYAQGS